MSGVRCKRRVVHTPTPRRVRLPLVASMFFLMAASCVGHRHSIGLGSTGTGEQTARQYYVLFGLFQANEVSAHRMAKDVTSYEVETKFGLWDILLQPLLLPLTMTTRTVIVRT